MQNACKLGMIMVVRNVQIRNVPDRVHRVLVRRAKQEGRSLQEYLLKLLADSADQPTVEEVLRRAARDSEGTVGLEQAAKLLREDRESH